MPSAAPPQPAALGGPANPDVGSAPAPLAPPAAPVVRWLVPLLAGLGGAAAGAALVVLAVALSSGFLATDDAFAAGLGEPLDVGSGLVEVPATGGAGAVEPEILVDVAGAVAEPGLHRLRAGDRVGDAIEAAGGFGARADLAASSQTLNLAQPLEDGAKVLVPELATTQARGSGAAVASDGRVDLNRADQSELESLPGIGPVTARKIIAARAERRFEAVRDLRSRGLVGESVYEDLESLVRVG